MQTNRIVRQTHFYPRPPRGGRPPVALFNNETITISIHALREEGDGIARQHLITVDGFLSTPSARRATTPGIDTSGSSEISIHALREEGDFNQVLNDDTHIIISIHALREEGDHVRCSVCRPYGQISIHALREEGDVRIPFI